MFNRIIVPLDGSALGQAALPLALALADATHDALDLVQIAPPLHAMWDYYLRYDTALDADRQDRAREAVDSLAARLRTPSRQIEAHVLGGDPAEEIVGYAAWTGPGLIALSTHGHGGIAHWAFGSVARKVLTAATVPTLIVRPRHPPEVPERATSIRTILVPLDGSHRAAVALPLVQELAHVLGAHVLLARVVPPATPAFTAMADGTPLPHADAAQAHERTAAETYLQRISDGLKFGGIPTDSVMPSGNVAAALLSLLQDEAYDLVVMTTHGRTGVTRWALGSIAERLVEASHTPILMLRSDAAAE